MTDLSWKLTVTANRTYLECANCRRIFWTAFMRGWSSSSRKDRFNLHRTYITSDGVDGVIVGCCMNGSTCSRKIEVAWQDARARLSQSQYDYFRRTITATMRQQRCEFTRAFLALPSNSMFDLEISEDAQAGEGLTVPPDGGAQKST